MRFLPEVSPGLVSSRGRTIPDQEMAFDKIYRDLRRRAIYGVTYSPHGQIDQGI